MKKACSKISAVCRTVFGYGIMLCLFAGGMTFFGYLAALIIGGDTAVMICTLIYKTVLTAVTRISTILVLLGLLAMYLNGEVALIANKKKSSKHRSKL